MIVIKIKGGLGNQLFQYAYGRYLSLLLKKQLFLDIEELMDRSPKKDFVFRNFDLDLFELDSYKFFEGKAKESFLKKRLFYKTPIRINEEGFLYKDYFIPPSSSRIYLDGYWQSYKYFESIEDILRKELRFKHKLSGHQLSLKDKIQNTNSVCINFRRTDFATLPSAMLTHGLTPIEFYYNAIELIRQKVGSNIELFVFSDDIPWCKANFKHQITTHFIEHKLYKGERFSAYLELMSICQHFIIPNSTFAWWAAWLSENKNKIVIYPNIWFVDSNLQDQTIDLFPNTWIKL